ncbi:hypothetical protein U1Q18_033431 [Sarracenia purpurea var. burkii]
MVLLHSATLEDFKVRLLYSAKLLQIGLAIRLLRFVHSAKGKNFKALHLVQRPFGQGRQSIQWYDMFFYERYPTLAPKPEVFETSGNLKSRSARWMDKRGGDSLPTVIACESEFIFRPYLQPVDGVIPGICDHTIYSTVIARQFGLDQGVPLCHPPKQHMYLTYRPYVTASSVAAAVDRVPSVVPNHIWVGDCTPHWTDFWAKNFAYLCKYMTGSTSSIQLEHVYDTDKDLSLLREKSRQLGARDRPTPFHQKLIIQYCSASTRSEDLLVSHDPSEHVLTIIRAPMEGVISRSRKRPDARLHSARLKKARVS